MILVEESLTAFHKINVTNPRFDHGAPAGFACPPVSPQIEVRISRIVSRGNCATLGMILGVAALAELVPLSCWNVLLHALALMGLMVVTSVCASRYDNIVFYQHRTRWHRCIKRVESRRFFGSYHMEVLG